MRVVALARDAPAGGGRIYAVSRIDVVMDPVQGCGTGKLMSARWEPIPGPRSRPFAGQRLDSAIWRPSPPDMLVAASDETRSSIPGDIRRDLPWILVLAAWRNILPLADSPLLEPCWDRGHSGPSSSDALDAIEREARFLAKALERMLHYAPPEELVALSRRRSPRGTRP